MDWVILYIVCVMIGGAAVGVSDAMSEKPLDDTGSLVWVFLVVGLPPLAIAVGTMIISFKLATRAQRSK